MTYGKRFIQHQSPASRQPGPLACLGGVLLVAGIVVGTAMMVGVFRERALRSAERELDNTVLLLARHFDQQLEDFITIQSEVATQAQLARLTSPEAFRARMSSLNCTTY